MNRFIVKPNKTVKEIIEGNKPLRYVVNLSDLDANKLINADIRGYVGIIPVSKRSHI